MKRSLLFAAMLMVPSLSIAHPLIITPAESNTATEICLSAAKGGMDALRSSLRDHKLTLEQFQSQYACNGMDIVLFTQKMKQKRKRTAKSLWMNDELNL